MRAAESTFDIIGDGVDRGMYNQRVSQIRQQEDPAIENRIISRQIMRDVPHSGFQRNLSATSPTHLRRSDSSPTPSTKYSSMQIRRPWHVAESLVSQYRYRCMDSYDPGDIRQSSATFRSIDKFIHPNSSTGASRDWHSPILTLPVRGLPVEGENLPAGFHPRVFVRSNSQFGASPRFHGRLAMFSIQSGLERSGYRNMVSLRNEMCSTYSSWMAKTRTLNNSYDWQRRMYIDNRHEISLLQREGCVAVGLTSSLSASRQVK